jgi:hypothetical protein
MEDGFICVYLRHLRISLGAGVSLANRQARGIRLGRVVDGVADARESPTLSGL